MAPVVLSVPFQIVRHLWVLVQVYGGNIESSKKGEKITTITRPDTVEKNLVASKIFKGEFFNEATLCKNFREGSNNLNLQWQINLCCHANNSN